MIKKREQEKAAMLGVAMRSHLTLLAPLMAADARPPSAREAGALRNLLQSAAALGLSLPSAWEHFAGHDLVDFISGFFPATASFLMAGELAEARMASRSLSQQVDGHVGT